MNCDRAIIGDIHGNIHRLSRALEKLSAMDRELIFVGDYINRGSNSREVIDVLCEFRAAYRKSVFLRGNHDDSLLIWLDGGGIDAFVRHGGLATVASYVSEPGPGVLESFRASYPASHHDFLASTGTYYEIPGLFISHAGYDPDAPDNRTVDALVYGAHASLFHEPHSRPQDLVVFGHFIQQSRKPYEHAGLVCIDTGCGAVDSGPLTVLLLPERAFLQF